MATRRGEKSPGPSGLCWGPEVTALDPAPREKGWALQVRPRAELGPGFAVGAVLVVPGALAVLVSLLVSFSEPALMLGGFATLVGGMILAAVYEAYRREAWFDRIELFTGNPELALGQEFLARIQFTLRKPLRVVRGRVRFYLEEKAVYRAGSDSRTFTREEYLQIGEWPLGNLVVPGDLQSLELAFRVPEDGPGSFVGENNYLTWKVDFQLELGEARDQEVSWDLTVRPVLRGAKPVVPSRA